MNLLKKLTEMTRMGFTVQFSDYSLPDSIYVKVRRGNIFSVFIMAADVQESSDYEKYMIISLDMAIRDILRAENREANDVPDKALL